MMSRTVQSFFLLFSLAANVSWAQSFKADVVPLLETSCLRCHATQAQAPLNLQNVTFDLSDAGTFRTWQKVFDRIQSGEMPPPGVARPDAVIRETALASLNAALIEANLKARGGLRTPLRRLTGREYEYTIADLLGIDEFESRTVGRILPAETDSGGFDTVAVKQGISALHVQSYLDAADRALDVAIRVGPRPTGEHRVINYGTSQYNRNLSRGGYLGGGVVKMVDDGAVTYSDTTSTYVFHSIAEGFDVPVPGRYRVSVEAYAYNADSTVVLTVWRGRKSGAAAALDEMLGMWDLVDATPRTVEVTPFLYPGDLVVPSVAEVNPPVTESGEFLNIFAADVVVQDYEGEGIAMKSMTIEGPLEDMWPPESTRQLLNGVEFSKSGQIRLTKPAYDHVVDIVGRFAPLAFRRPVATPELEAYASLAKPVLAADRPFLEAVRVSLRAILSAPSFLYQSGDSGALDEFGLATRLSYFLWRSLPDTELFDLAHEGRLSDPAVLTRQVNRMLDDPKSERFVKDFSGQAFRLYEINATTPDPGLYPEYDGRLGVSMVQETELFLNELIAENLGIMNLVDSDFTFANRRLADHYGFPHLDGQEMQKVRIPSDSVRGGLLTQGSILKITANGTTTSPVPRGNFVLSNLLGAPAPPPPPGVAGLEPDTRGSTTIREQLAAHRVNPTCANCHRTIDPPGFALESFDPIGGFRKNYRVSGGTSTYGEFEFPNPYEKGPAVDPGGVRPTGEVFSNVVDYKRLLLEHDAEQIAWHFVSQLIVFSTGAEIEFADRDDVSKIVDDLKDKGYPIRTMIHAVVDSDLFRSR